jgi:putative heme-binding domain-containing protein
MISHDLAFEEPHSMKHRFLAATIAVVLAGFSLPASAASRGLDTVIEALASIAEPAAQADVLRGIAEALKGRRNVPMPPGWRPLYISLQKSQDPDVRSLAMRLALTFGDADAIAALRQTAGDLKADASSRLAAVEALAQAHDDHLGPILIASLDDPSLADTAIRDLPAYSEPAAPAALISRYAKFDDVGRRDAIATLSTKASWGMALLDAVDAGKVPRTDLSALTIRQLSTLNDPALNDRLKKSYGSVRAHGKDKAALIEKYKKTFAPDLLAKADLSHGRLVFSKTCGVCHTLYDAGGKLGPNLTGSQRANLDYLLEKVTDPSAVVPKENYMVIIETADGRTLTGIVVQETDTAMVLRDTTQDITLPKAEIKSRHSSTTSMMPEGLLEQMSTADARDLIGYLQGKAQVPMGK